MRRIVRGISRVLKGEPPQPDLTEMARDYWINRGKQADSEAGVAVCGDTRFQITP